MPPEASFARPECMLLFELGDGRFALPFSTVGGVVDCGPLRPVPGGPPAVLGLASWRGSVLTVLDLPRLLGREASAEAACLVLLAPPLQRLALFVPSRVRIAPAGELDDGAAEVRVLDPARLVDLRQGD